MELLFTEIVVFVPSFVIKPLVAQGAFKRDVSMLTKLIGDSLANSSRSAAPERGTVALTIYLPDYSEMSINVKAEITILELINQVLLKHKALGLKPPMEYNALYKYEMRHHEGMFYYFFTVFSK